jgi:DNA repair protein RecN (Recombination protein N)
VASGGELSRIMLAIKTVIAGQDDIGTLIFDEIDAGISGRTAQLTALKLAQLSKFHQIICITHLPQIASMADIHFMIEKYSDGMHTATQIYALDQKQSVEELARLLGGTEITEAVISNAQEMKMLAGQAKLELSK